MISNLIDEKAGSINMTELGKQNGLSDKENLKNVLSILFLKQEITGIPQKIEIHFSPRSEVEK